MSVKMLSESEKLDLEEGESVFVSYSVELTCYMDGLSPKYQWQYCTEANPTIVSAVFTSFNYPTKIA